MFSLILLQIQDSDVSAGKDKPVNEMNGDSVDMNSVNLEGQLEAMTLAHEQKQLVSKPI